jgi:hypothetical protein
MFMAVAAFGVPLIVLAGTTFPVTLLPRFLLEIAWSGGWQGRVNIAVALVHSLEEVVRALSGIDASSISLQRVSLEHAYLEAVHERPEQIQDNCPITHSHLAATAS